jgi:hypothetical protein
MPSRKATNKRKNNAGIVCTPRGEVSAHEADVLLIR